MNSNVSHPTQFPRRILLATVGLVPQVVTETLWALCRDQTPPFIPTEIHVITTAEGRERTRLMLLDPSRAILAKFAEEFGLPQVSHALSPDRIHVVHDHAGEPMGDITTEAGNRAMADLITRIVRELTADETAALHVSIAGGRKTMGFLLGAALSLFGRQQDRLSHVLIEPPQLEQHPKFFYPPLLPVVLQDTREPNRPIDTRDARVTVADIPFVRLRNGLPKRMLEGGWTYSETVERAQALVREPELIIDMTSGLVSCGGIVVELGPLPLIYYAWLAERRIRLGDNGGVHRTDRLGDDLVRAHVAVCGLAPDVVPRLRRDVADGHIPATLIEQRNTRINKILTHELGQRDTPYHIASVGVIPGTQYERTGLLMAPAAIKFGVIRPNDNEPDES